MLATVVHWHTLLGGALTLLKIEHKRHQELRRLDNLQIKLCASNIISTEVPHNDYKQGKVESSNHDADMENTYNKVFVTLHDITSTIQEEKNLGVTFDNLHETHVNQIVHFSQWCAEYY